MPMKKRQRAKQPQVAALRGQLLHRNVFSAVVLTLMLTFGGMPIGAAPRTDNASDPLGMQAASTLTFSAEADARVEEAHPSNNYGSVNSLLVNGVNNPDIESFIRFTVSGVTGLVQSARLRIYVTTNSSANGPAAYGANNTWVETEITWRNRPARASGVLDNKGTASTNSWVEYNVSSFMTGNGTYSFVLAADSSDGITFSSREGERAPQLVVTFGSSASTPTFTPSSEATATNTASATPTFTPSPSATSTDTDTPPASSTSTSTPTLTEAPGAASTSTAMAPTGAWNTLTFTPNADARVSQVYQTSNYGMSTSLLVDGNSGETKTSYIRFTISELSGPIQSVKLRVFCTTNGTTNGPEIYLASSNWVESGTGGITWNNKPALLSGAFDNKTTIGLNSWVEYDVTAFVAGNGMYTFALVADSADGVVFSSREGQIPPQLVVTVGTRIPIDTQTATPTDPGIATTTRTSTPTDNETPSATSTASSSVVLVGAGDISNCNRSQDEQTAQLLDNIHGTVFTAGDNAYISGSYTEYINCYERTWGRHKSRTKPSPGNHEYLTSGAAGYFQYFNNVPSYYAYNLGTWRIYSLNSEISVSSTSAQATWLQDDLAINPSQCVMAYWHRPRWSSGANHGDDSAMQAIWQILYNAGAELVVNGHEHDYERFAEMNASGAAVSQGLREIVAGTGGAGLYPFGTPKAASQVRNNTTYGVLKLTLRSTGYDWEFVPIAGSTFTDSGSSNCH
jgi:acid phosphatase type 7